MKKIITLICLLSVTGCSSTTAPASIVTFVPSSHSSVPKSAPQTIDVDLTALTLSDALRLARETSPALAAARHKITGQQHRQRAAGQTPNPRVTLGNEKIGLSQPIVIGGDLQEQRSITDAQLGLAEARFQQASLAVDAELRGAFAALLMLQTANEYQQEIVTVSAQCLQTARLEVEAGESTADVISEKLITDSKHQAQAESISCKLALAQQQLATLLNVSAQGLAVEGDLSSIVEIPKLEELLSNIDQIPLIAESLSRAQVAKARAKLAYAQAIPDFNLELFYTDDAQIEAAILFELPLNSRNNALHSSAKQSQLAAQSELDLATQQTRISLQMLRSELEHATEDYSRMHNVVLAAYLRSYDIASTRFLAGDISEKQLRVARLSLLNAQIEDLQAWLLMMQSWQDVRALVKTVPNSN